MVLPLISIKLTKNYFEEKFTRDPMIQIDNLNNSNKYIQIDQPVTVRNNSWITLFGSTTIFISLQMVHYCQRFI